MANTCFNELYFTGDSAKVQRANLFLAGLPRDEWGGVTIEGTDGYFQDIGFSRGRFLFGTRWGPQLETARVIADRFGVGFVYDYCEPMMSLYGQARYEKGQACDIRLGQKDFAGVSYLEDDDVYVYQNTHYRSIETLSRLLLQERLQVKGKVEKKAAFKTQTSLMAFFNKQQDARPLSTGP
ncbi:DUF1281 family ferredoxin-like fold protein [Mucilaginibacter pedocola]|uniref:YubB ferredoxin-like domain-containing protein n=1 Tax=Mucilaginibacter pedocola TaxID=1792845 RepID=A0A1S9PBE8_9SPHI|nr:hypothetical protein [Mucilaginibacter pedocola]OOQ58280.1 hypothetical protein BC343_11640 [Mucilaginibacter pedocola]